MNIPTRNFFYGMEVGEEIIVELDRGKTLLIELVSYGKANEDGIAKVFFKVNGQTRDIEVQDRSVKVEKVVHRKVDKSDRKQVGAPLQGSLSSILVEAGEQVEKNQPLFIIEAMKMETTITANTAGEVEQVLLQAGTMVFADDLVLVLK